MAVTIITFIFAGFAVGVISAIFVLPARVARKERKAAERQGLDS